MEFNTKSFSDMEDKEREEEMDFLSDIIWKKFVERQKNIIKESEKLKPLASYMTDQEINLFINTI
jgi:hypothetical protein